MIDLNSERKRSRAVVALGLALVTVLVLAACGGGGSSSGSSGGAGTSSTEDGTGEGAAGGAAAVAATALKIAEEHVEVTKIGPTKPIGKPIPSGKTIDYVNCGQPSCVLEEESMKEAGETLGWKVEGIQAEPTPQSIQAAFEEAVRKKPDGVASAGFGPALYPKQLAELNKLNIPVFEATGEVESGENGVAYDPVGPGAAVEAMQVLANKTISDMGGEGEAAAVLLTGYPIVAEYTKAWEEEIESKCPECTVTQMEIQPTSIGKDAPEKITNFVRANSGTKALFLSYDLLGSGLAAAMKTSGVTMPMTYSWSPEGQGIEALQNGERTAAAVNPHPESAWQMIDGFARVFTGQNPIQPSQQPTIWSETFENVPTAAEPFPEVIPGYREQFEALWGLK
jgi:ribose transport system substrate-binding protein